MAKMVGISLKKRDTTWDRLSWKNFWRQYTLVRYPCLGEFCLPHFQDVPRFFGEKKIHNFECSIKAHMKKALLQWHCSFFCWPWFGPFSQPPHVTFNHSNKAIVFSLCPRRSAFSGRHFQEKIMVYFVKNCQNLVSRNIFEKNISDKEWNV